MDQVAELEPPVVQLACRNCAVAVELAVGGDGMARTMREFFEAHLSGSAAIHITAVESALAG
jgi:hypothetical protein